MRTAATRLRLALYLALYGTSGCAVHTLHVEPLDPRLYGGSPGAIAVEASAPATTSHQGSAARGAGQGALRGAGNVAGALLDGADGRGILLLPVGALAGAVGGALMAHSREEIDQAAKELDRALQESELAPHLRELFLKQAADLTSQRLLPWESASDATSSEVPIDRVLRLFVSDVSFAYEGNIKPHLLPTVVAVAQLWRPSDAACLFERRWVHVGQGHPFFDLTRNQAEVFRAELRAATEQLAVRMASDVFGPTQAQLIGTEIRSRGERRFRLEPADPVRPSPSRTVKAEYIKDSLHSTALSLTSTADAGGECPTGLTVEKK